jgi:NADPH-dependent curcumin reductase CurA
MTATANRQLLLASHPKGRVRDEDFRLAESPLPALAEGQVQVRTIYISIDPTMRIWLHPADNYLPMLQHGEVMRSVSLGVVEASRSSAHAVGAFVQGLWGCQEHAVVDAAAVMPLPPIAPLPLTAHFSLLGHIGMTAYCGLVKIGRPLAGETVVVSAAAGAVGSLVGQIGRILGCRVVGIAGGEAKCRHLTEVLGFDAAVDYRRDDFAAALKEACPKGIDVYFDNVGGEMLDLALTLMNVFGRIVACGMISTYNDLSAAGPRNIAQVVIKRLRMEGFVILDPQHDAKEAYEHLLKWAAEGRLQHRAHILEGLECVPDAINMLLEGRNQGKLLVRVGQEP